MNDDDHEKSWEQLDPEVRKALISSAKSSLWWRGLGERIKGMGPLATAILALIAVVQIFGERLHQWLTSGL